MFHPQVATGFSHCFVWGRKNPDLRPSAEAWQAKFGVLPKKNSSAASARMITCTRLT